MIRRHVRTHGIGGTVRYAMERAIESGYERSLGIDTRSAVHIADLGFTNPDMQDYHPVSYSGLRDALNACAIDPTTEVFFDYGVGKGRAILLAGRWPFRRVAGIELAPELVAVARANIARALPRLRCENIRVDVGDATRYPLPDDVTIAHFYNPFRGAALQATAEQIAASLRRNPRRMKILFAYPDDFERIIDETDNGLGAFVLARTRLPWRFSPDRERTGLYTSYELSSLP